MLSTKVVWPAWTTNILPVCNIGVWEFLCCCPVCPLLQLHISPYWPWKPPDHTTDSPGDRQKNTATCFACSKLCRCVLVLKPNARAGERRFKPSIPPPHILSLPFVWFNNAKLSLNEVLAGTDIPGGWERSLNLILQFHHQTLQRAAVTPAFNPATHSLSPLCSVQQTLTPSCLWMRYW